MLEQLRQLRSQRLREERRDFGRSNKVTAARKVAKLARPGCVIAKLRFVQHKLDIPIKRNPATRTFDLGSDARCHLLTMFDVGRARRRHRRAR